MNYQKLTCDPCEPGCFNCYEKRCFECDEANGYVFAPSGEERCEKKPCDSPC